MYVALCSVKILCISIRCVLDTLPLIYFDYVL